jgi:subtilase family serine protease
MFPKQSKLGVLYQLIVVALVLTVTVAAQTAGRITEPVDPSRTVALPGNVSPLAKPEFDLGAAPASMPMQRMLLVLRRSPEQEQALQLLIESQHNPQSNSYHQWLTPNQFGQTFGPSQSDIAKVTAWLMQNGFQVANISRGRTVIEFSGTAAQVKQAFLTEIHQYQLSGKSHWANAKSPQIPVALAPVVAGVASLNSFTKHATSRWLGTAKVTQDGGRAKIVPLKPAFSSGGVNYVAPGDFWTIYNATPLITASSPIDGMGQTIAIAGRSDVQLSDITGFRNTLLPAPYSSTVPFNQIINGPDPGDVSGDDVENTLDVEWSSALAPAATIDLVVSQSTAMTDGVDLSQLYIVDNNLAPVMSSSYSLCEAYLGAAENQFLYKMWEQAAAQGITSIVSSGDNGSAGCDNQDASGYDNAPSVAFNGLQVNGLSSTPFNVSVGGNNFTDDSSTYWGSSQSVPAPFTSALSHVPEAVWNESCSPTDLTCGDGPEDASLWAGSGGASGCLNATLDQNFNILNCQGAYAKPSWQNGVFGIPYDKVRDIPDVSFTAAGHDGYLICIFGSCQSGYFGVVGGTSASAPAFAGVMGLVNQKTGNRQGQANYVLYPLAASEYGSQKNPNNANLASCNSSNGNAVGSSCIFYDVTAGTNAVPCSAGSRNCSATAPGTYGVLKGYSAKTGYDQATGLGSVNVANLVNNWSTVSAGASATTTTLSVTPTSGLKYGQAATVSIQVAPTKSHGTPSGDVALVTNSTDPNAQAVAMVTLTDGYFSGAVNTLPAGTYTLYARYAGDRRFATSVSQGIAITLGPTNSKLAMLVAATDPVTGAVVRSAAIPYGSNVAVTASVVRRNGLATPTGSVLFQQGSATVSNVTLDGNGNATSASSSYAPGAYSLAAQYSGDHNYNPSAGSAPFNVVKAQPVVELLSPQGLVVGKGSATLIATVQTHSFQTAPSGTVTFHSNGQLIGSAPVTATTDAATGASDAVATFTVSSSMLVAGINRLSANYHGDQNYESRAAALVKIDYAVSSVPNTITLTASSPTATVGETVTLLAEATSAGFNAMGGTITFMDGARTLANVQVVGAHPAAGFKTGTATLKLRLGPGNHVIRALYGGVAGALSPVRSDVVEINVTGTTASQTTLAAQPDATNPSNFDFTANVLGYGFDTPSGTLFVRDITTNTVLGEPIIKPTTAVHTLAAPILNSNGPGTPFGLAVADLNGDGIPDIVTSDAQFGPSTSSVYIGNGDGTFRQAVAYPTGYFSDGVAVADFNNDGIPDIAVTNQGDTGSNGSVSILLGNGDGTFQPQMKFRTTLYTSFGVAGDFNHDGVTDLAILDILYGNVQIAYGNGDGTFTTGPLYPGIPSGNYYPFDLKIGDLNKDGNLDLVVVDNWGGNLGLLLGNSDGTFQPAQFYPVGNQPWNVAIGDMNNDGKPDFVVSNYGDNTVGVLLGNGDGTFQAMTTYPTGGYYDPTVYLADMNGDGKLDVIAPSFYNAIGANVLQILSGNGDGTLQSPVDYTLPQQFGQAAIAADLNGDGAPDLVVAQTDSNFDQGYVLSYLNATQGTATLSNVSVPGSGSQRIVARYSGNKNHSGSKSQPITVP